MSSGKSFKV